MPNFDNLIETAQHMETLMWCGFGIFALAVVISCVFEANEQLSRVLDEGRRKAEERTAREETTDAEWWNA